jgi:hypothetical protein
LNLALRIVSTVTVGGAAAAGVTSMMQQTMAPADSRLKRAIFRRKANPPFTEKCYRVGMKGQSGEGFPFPGGSGDFSIKFR